MTEGSKYPVWWHTGSQPPNQAKVLKVLPYQGKYPQWFDAALRLSAPNTETGYLEMAVKLPKGENQ